MFGTSYGGFAAIQAAAHRPPALAAIAPHAATDDRYRTDVHQAGGLPAAIDRAGYALMMVALNALPPDTDADTLGRPGEPGSAWPRLATRPKWPASTPSRKPRPGSRPIVASTRWPDAETGQAQPVCRAAMPPE